MTDDSEPVFACAAFGPAGDVICQEGLTTRDYFAAMALRGFCQRSIYCGDIAKDAYELADQMLGARKEKR